MYTPTITRLDLKEWDLLFYRWNRTFSWLIRIYETIKCFDIRHPIKSLMKLFIAFTHVAQVLYRREFDSLFRFDAMEGHKTGFRDVIGKAYVFRFTESLTAHELMVWRQYLLAREWSNYDMFWALYQIDNVFDDFCSELSENALVAIKRIKDEKHLSPYQFYRKLRKKLTFIGVII